MANMHLVTGYAGSDHVTAADHGSLYAGIFGTGNYVLNRGGKFAVTVVSSNRITIADGDLILQGRHIRVNHGTTVSLTITSGSQGYYRNDLIVARYTRNSSTGKEEANLVVIKGTATTGTASDPATNEANDLLNNNATTVDFPLYRIPISGITVGTPVQLFDVVSPAMVGEDGKIASSYLPDMDYIPTSKRGAANGVAPLNASKKVDSTYLPTIPTVSSSLTSTSTTTAASSYAVKQAYDKAAAAATGTVNSGTISEASSGQYWVAQFGKVVVCSGYFVPDGFGNAFQFTLPLLPSAADISQRVGVVLTNAESSTVESLVAEYVCSRNTLYVDGGVAGTYHFSFSYISA